MVYTLTLAADGFAAWKGEAFVDRTGAHIGEVGAAAFAELANLAVTGGFFSLDDEYPPPATDLPDFELVVETGARDKFVRTWGSGEPEPFRDLAEEIDRVANSIDWRSLELNEPPD
jgi:Domain of unknown function (DUF6438)